MAIEGHEDFERNEPEKKQHPLVTVAALLALVALIAFGLANGANECSPHDTLSCGPNGLDKHSQ